MKDFSKKLSVWLGQLLTWAGYAETQSTSPQMSALTEVRPEYRKIESVLTYRELGFLWALRRANEGKYTILMKVRLADFIWLVNDPPDKRFHKNQIMSKHVDFLLCHRVTLEPLLVIELDDSTHDLPDHAARDRFKDETFEMAGLACLRVPLQKEYDIAALKQQLNEKIAKYPTPAPGHRWYA